MNQSHSYLSGASGLNKSYDEKGTHGLPAALPP
jgi:hypothetical protein